MHIPTEILTSAGGDALFHEGKALLEKFFQSDAGKKVAEAFGKKFEKPFTDKQRAQMINFVFGSALLKKDPNVSVNIERHLIYAAQHDWTGDNTLVKCLLLAFESERAKDKDGNYIYPNPEDDQRLLAIFAEIGSLDNIEEFRQRLERYDHDPAEQILRKAVSKIQEGVDVAGKWMWGFIAYAAAWPMILMIGAAGTSRHMVWGMSILPAIILLAITMMKVNPLYIVLGNWVDKRYQLNFLSTAWTVIGLHVMLGIYLGYYPIKSFDLIFLLYIASIALFFLGMGKGSLVGLGKLACYGLVMFAFYANHTGITSADTTQIETGIAKAAQVIGLGPGSSQDNPIILGTSDTTSFSLKKGEGAWFKIEANKWSQPISVPYKSAVVIEKMTSQAKEQWYIPYPEGGGYWDPNILIDGPNDHPIYPELGTAIRYLCPRTLWVKISVKR